MILLGYMYLYDGHILIFLSVKLVATREYEVSSEGHIFSSQSSFMTKNVQNDGYILMVIL